MNNDESKNQEEPKQEDSESESLPSRFVGQVSELRSMSLEEARQSQQEHVERLRQFRMELEKERTDPNYNRDIRERAKEWYKKWLATPQQSEIESDS